MSQTETTFLRALDIGETQFWLFDQISTMNFSVFALGSGLLEVSALLLSLKIVQLLYPLAHVGIQKANDSKSLLFFSSSNEIPLQIKRAGLDWQQQLAIDTSQTFAPADAPLIRAFLYMLEGNKWVFSLVFHHSIADGKSGIRFFKDVLSNLDKSHPATEPKKTSIPMHSMLPDALAHWSGNSGSLPILKTKNLPTFSEKTSKAKPTMAILHLEKKSLKKLREQARANLVSVHGILGAIQLKAIAELYEDFQLEAIPLNLSTPADARAYLADKLDETNLGLYITLLTSHVEITEKTPFWELARALANDVKNQLEGLDGLLFYKKLPNPTSYLENEKSLRLFSLLMKMMPQATVLSNVGVVPYFSPPFGINLSYLAFSVPPSITQPVCITVTTFHEQMNIVINYDFNRLEKIVFDKFCSNYTNTLLKLTN